MLQPNSCWDGQSRSLPQPSQWFLVQTLMSKLKGHKIYNQLPDPLNYSAMLNHTLWHEWNHLVPKSRSKASWNQSKNACIPLLPTSLPAAEIGEAVQQIRNVWSPNKHCHFISRVSKVRNQEFCQDKEMLLRCNVTCWTHSWCMSY